MLAGALILPLFVAMFAAPLALSAGAAAVWTGVAFLVAAAAYALFQVPYVSMPAEMTDDYQERTTIVSFRIVALTVGILAAGPLAPALVDSAGGGRAGRPLDGRRDRAVHLLASMLAAVVGTRKAPRTTRPTGAGSLLTAIRVARKNPWFLRLWGTFVVQALATAATLAAIPYFATYILGNEKSTTLLFAGLVAPAIVVMPLWTRYARRVGKKHAYVAASLLYAAASLLMVLGRVVPTAVVLLFVVMAVSATRECSSSRSRCSPTPSRPTRRARGCAAADC